MFISPGFCGTAARQHKTEKRPARVSYRIIVFCSLYVDLAPRTPDRPLTVHVTF